ncbi:VirK/YbjX family protein [Rodentibacter heidelbergensis]|uniref:DUF535 domain-containing protein n=1 Tax=Rodentibacter heidelbergensis TaxID=1908258 RepID=A0A1V3I7U8_9PAST|nr:DUF535 family protein [Rodentibacter heidelbergensis]OOF36133.1 hypothetical protein BKK48_06780 [Rodentibacter heidelbergensis]
MKTPQYTWVKANVIHPDRPGRSDHLKRLRYQLRSFLHRHWIKKFEHFVNQHPFLIELLNERVNYSYPLVCRFLDKRFTASQRFVAICDNLLFLPEKLTALSIPLWKQPLSFGEIIPDFEMTLSMTTHQPMEGYWVLELWHKPQNELVYLLTFAKLGDALLIAVVQGPNFNGAKEMVKQLTKACHGLRPAYLMVETMKALTRILGFKTLLGIPQKYQNKSRFIQSKHYSVDYDAIFSESGGQRKDYWILPLEEKKSLDDIPSKKRSMYRKRYRMLNEFAAVMAEKLNIKG